MKPKIKISLRKLSGGHESGLILEIIDAYGVRLSHAVKVTMPLCKLPNTIITKMIISCAEEIERKQEKLNKIMSSRRGGKLVVFDDEITFGEIGEKPLVQIEKIKGIKVC